MKHLYLLSILALAFACSPKTTPTSSSSSSPSAATYESTVAKYQKFEGFFDFYWDEKSGKIYLEIDNLGEEFLYVNSLAAGVGSNDIGLDRGQLGDTRVVKFERSGPKIFLVQPNQDYRALSDNQNEVLSVEEAFAKSIVAGFKVEKEEKGKILIDITDLLLSDAHGVAQRIKRSNQGSYSLDASRSAVYLERTKNFKDNSEFEATITFKGTPSGYYLRSVTPSPEAVTVRMHHSFVRLPDDGYEKRKYDPRAGYYGITYQDYATPIEESLVKRFIVRHRLEKKDPDAAVSEAVEPIIYYVDKGAPEPVRSALIEGASWWNQAFEKAGYKNAFQVKVLPDSADPLDINYNVIQWVHRSTRGWSYGASVVDPRTGEILKGHVSLGSLRIRQDFLIATGLLQPYEEGKEPSGEMLEMALARLRQLSAHEVGHTLGLYHNFAASVNDRASVMDYPHPYIQLDKSGEIDLSEAYDVNIGEWDQFAIRYGYTDIQGDEDKPLNDIIDEWIAAGYQYIMDSDARPQSGAHAQAHLWDGGKNAAEELNRLAGIRSKVLTNFSESAIQTGEPISSIEEVLVPMYFIHRYQIEGASKMLGGLNYAYKVKGDNLPLPSFVSAADQKLALSALSNTLTPEFLSIPNSLLQLLSPKTPGYGRTRESFKSNTGVAFDPIAAAETSAEMTVSFIFTPERVERVIQQNLRDSKLPGWDEVMASLYKVAWNGKYKQGLEKEIKMVVEKRIVYHLMNLAGGKGNTEMTKAVATQELANIVGQIKGMRTNDLLVKAHYNHVLSLYDQFVEEPGDFTIPSPQPPPDGSPIGMDCAN
ncbi:MAG: peptidase [Flammeovirgaceae bacterium]|nr:peptidase [Flammeovirgaceae bacterium]HCX22381.1 peptidase [Cytophagales bacterium]|tara:strand:- start:1993 stop:4443 length:2451 start_codon:yes stop_codon:yes gene_type:complete